MKTIGLIGGMSWESSKLYYETINRKTSEIFDGINKSKTIMISVDYSEIEKLSFENNWEAISDIIKDAAIKLENAGADMVLLCTNAIHKVSSIISESISIPFLHIAEATGQSIKRKGLKKVGLIGTKFAMEGTFYSNYISENFNVDIIIPNEKDRQIIHKMVYDELVKGIFTTKSKETCKRIINDLKNNGAEGVILGCTELPILIPTQDIDIPSFDTGKIHAELAVQMAIN